MPKHSASDCRLILEVSNFTAYPIEHKAHNLIVKDVYYPKVVPSRCFYDDCRTPNGGYGGLLSATFYTDEDVIAFYDNLDTEKGPSLGTNFTLASPYTLLAHFTELEWAAQYGVEKALIRFSIGLEDTEQLLKTVDVALAAIPA